VKRFLQRRFAPRVEASYTFETEVLKKSDAVEALYIDGRAA
jgi:hypothetical protein